MAAPLYNCNWTGLLEKEQIPANNPNQQTNKQNLDVNNSCTADAQQRIWHGNTFNVLPFLMFLFQ